MYRSGESEYLINGTVARRMDVLDILHDSGLGTGTHPIISQGSLDSILQSKPEDRRALIEEAAGVLKHKQRKAKSERKLEQMDQHLARARDVVAEVERQLGPLERKAKRARAYQGLAAELSEPNLQLAVDDLRVLQRKWDEASTREQTLEAELEERRDAIAQAEARAEERAGERPRRESVDAGWLARRHRLASQAVDRIDSAALVMRERQPWRPGARGRGSWKCSLEANKAKRAVAEGDLAQARAQLEQVQGERSRADAQAARLAEAGRGACRQALPGPGTRGDRAGPGAPSSWTPRWTPRGVSRRRRRRPLGNGLAHVAAGRGPRQGTGPAGSNARNRTPRRWRRPPLRASGQRAELEAREAAARARVGEAFQAREEARGAADAARDEERAVASEIKGIEEVERASAAASGPALSWLLEHEAELQAGLAPLAHAVSAPRGKEALVEHLLGPDVTALLVADAARAREVAQALSESGKAGEVSLVLCEDAAGCAEGACPARAAAAHGTPLVDQLSFPEDAARAVRALLGDVVLCDSLDDALEGHARDAAGLRFATPDGCIVWPSGKVTLGATAAEDEEGALARARRLEDARVRHGAAQEALAQALAAAEEAEEALRKAQAESLALSQAGAEAGRRRRGPRRGRPRRREAGRGAARAGGRGAPARRRRAVHRRDPPERGRPRRARGRPCAGELEETKEKLAAAQDAAAPLRDEAQRASEALSEARLSAATLAERETYTSRVREAREREIKQLANADAEARATLRKKKAAMVRIEPLLAAFEELVDSARRWTRDLEDQATAAQDSTSGLHAAANEARAAARQAQAAFDAANERMSAARVDKGRLEVQVEAAVNVIVHDCKTPLETALALPELEDRAEAEGTAFKLRRRIANMGTINPDAADEYEELKRRYDYLAGQLADLDGARRTLAKINRVIDARMKDDFVRTYEAVDKNFQEIFGVLFPGGSAHLSLVDPDDLENTGVEVSAQPRGKRITKMMLMSGGEKSLTALALLFAVYRIRATPFYILDEVEAALDDSNLRRLASYIDSLRDRTQLIMITHQRRTMEMADVLFGVSMQADGVTKVISQKLEHALQHAE